MTAHVKLDGFEELIRDLTNAPKEIRDEGLVVVKDHTEALAVEWRREFDGPTGNLRRSVKTEFPSSTILIGQVKATAPHAHLRAWGTKQRRNRAGANRGRGPALSPNIGQMAQSRRTKMFRALIEMLQRKGFQVTT